MQADMVELNVGILRSLKKSGSHIDASHSRQPLVKRERLVRYEVNAVMHMYVAEQTKDLLAARHGVRACMGLSKFNGKPKTSSYYVSTRTYATTCTYI